MGSHTHTHRHIQAEEVEAEEAEEEDVKGRESGKSRYGTCCVYVERVPTRQWAATRCSKVGEHSTLQRTHNTSHDSADFLRGYVL